VTAEVDERQHLVLIPGLSCDAALWEAQVSGLWDLAEFSIGDISRDDSIAVMASRILAQAPPRFAVAGASMGGYVAMEIWRRAPERVSRIALLSTNARADNRHQSAIRRGSLVTAQERGFEAVVRDSLNRLVRPEAPETLREAIVTMSLRVGFDAYRRQQTAIIERPDSRDDLPTIDVPTMILVGEDDRFTPPALSEEMAGMIRGAVLERIADCGHFPTLEQPEAVTAALRRWLSQAA
jgi:pimeloyl-ACP methyl ester carboxylesterase